MRRQSRRVEQSKTRTSAVLDVELVTDHQADLVVAALVELQQHSGRVRWWESCEWKVTHHEIRDALLVQTVVPADSHVLLQSESTDG